MGLPLRPRKSLGQNFLTDDNIARKIVRAIGPQPTEIVVEIGPGKGALTRHLLSHAKRVVGVEIDKRAIEILEKTFESELRSNQLQLRSEDFLTLDLHELSKTLRAPLRIVGNIPYYITSPILFRVIEQRRAVRDLTILVQLEVANRIVARPNTRTYGILSVFCQFYGKPKLLFKVPPTAFYPKPKVVSALLRIEFAGEPISRPVDERVFVSVVRATFGKRRKTLRNGLKYSEFGDLDLSKLDFDLRRRPEQLSVEEFVNLSNMIADFKSHRKAL
jgi:16S rRNA (adenine1518-N6/adenine1519-N6)-dimethyltransferase